MRLGEALGLSWADVDLDTGTLRPTTHSDESMARTLTMPASVVAALRAHKVRQLEARLLADERWADGGLVFTNAVGRTMEPSNVLKAFKRHLAAAELPPQRFHDLRHFAAPLLLAQNVPARVVMDILGQPQLGKTMDLYSHVMPAAL